MKKQLTLYTFLDADNNPSENVYTKLIDCLFSLLEELDTQEIEHDRTGLSIDNVKHKLKSYNIFNIETEIGDYTIRQFDLVGTFPTFENSNYTNERN